MRFSLRRKNSDDDEDEPPRRPRNRRNRRRPSAELENQSRYCPQWMPHSNVARATLFLIFFEALLVTALEATVGAQFLSDQLAQGLQPFEPVNGKGIPVYIFIFIFAMAWLVWAGFDAIRHQNTIQVIGLVCFNFACLVYSIFQYFQLLSGEVHHIQTVLLIVIPVTIGLCGFAYIILAMKLYMEFGWKIYKRIGADVKMKIMFRSYQIFLTVLKLDIFFFFGFSVQNLVLVLQSNDPEVPITIVALVLTAVGLLLAVYGVRRESRGIMQGFIFGLFFGMAYFIFKIVRMYDPSQARKYTHTRNFLTFFAALSLMMLVFTLVGSIACYRNFNKGLRRFVDGSIKTPPKQNLGFFTIQRNPDGTPANQEIPVIVEPRGTGVSQSPPVLQAQPSTPFTAPPPQSPPRAAVPPGRDRPLTLADD